ncbi:gluconolactonase [Lewinella aquimaris]|uniref:Gluconolactonase n=1 Tax=Neolewinella aquimaris TaxID=1835722 RepID=A0A840E6K3_9BACT|nr:SMP-30/gluconolactonase/LRE family protein [Neolewinella aquimaris]MBB4077728.1 gluconolactonase [Neolewinella aquimaris]
MTKLLPLWLLLLAVGCRSKVSGDVVTTDDNGLRIEAFDEAATRSLFGETPVIEVLFGGMDWSEGPLVLPDGTVICSDVPRNHILQWVGDTSRVWLANSGAAANEYSGEPGSNGLALTADNQLLLCQHGSRRVARMEAPVTAPRAEYSTLADHYEGKQFNSPNDLVVARDGSVLFTDPPYGLPRDAERDMDYCGVFRVDPRGTVTLLTKEYSRPNGIGLSPDEKTLYIGNSDGKRAVVTATPILDEEFTLGEARILIDATDLAGSVPGSPDGLAVAADGRIYATSPGGVWVIKPDGTLLSKIRSDAPVSNVELSPHEDWLYLTNDDRLVRVQLNKI